MRESSLIGLYERRCELLNQLSTALRGRTVALWRLARGDLAMTEAVSRRPPPAGAVEFDVARVLRRWGRLALPQSLWVGCRVDADRWHVAAVRSDPPAPPPTGLERRSPERLVVELGGLCLGAHERAWLAVDQATVYLCSALELLERCAGRIRTAEGLSATERAHILADLANLADVIEGALHV
ncbi:MAG TPA: hypothetical protein VK113_09050 [Gemmatimonadales bacterium]|nr:hypothetical protein [Gemmatimonadales bacterium]